MFVLRLLILALFFSGCGIDMALQDESTSIGSDQPTVETKVPYYDSIVIEKDSTSMQIDFPVTGFSDLSNIDSLTVLGDALFFRATDVLFGQELWSYNTVTREVKRHTDININGDSNIGKIFIHNQDVYLSADDGISGVELWRLNTSANTVERLTDINSSGSSEIDHIFGFENNIYFSANDGVNGREPWIYNITNQSVSPIHDLHIAGDGSPREFIELGGLIYFSGDAGIYNQRQLWVYDPNTQIAQITEINNQMKGNPLEIIKMNGKLYFLGCTNLNVACPKMDVHDYNPNTNLITYVADTNIGGGFPITFGLVGIGNKLYATARNGGGGAPFEMVEYTPSPDNVRYLTGINNVDGNIYGINNTNINDKLIFSGNDGVNGYRVWSYDPLSDNASMLSESSTAQSSFANFVFAGDKIFYTALEAGQVKVFYFK